MVSKLNKIPKDEGQTVPCMAKLDPELHAVVVQAHDHILQ